MCDSCDGDSYIDKEKRESRVTVQGQREETQKQPRPSQLINGVGLI